MDFTKYSFRIGLFFLFSLILSASPSFSAYWGLPPDSTYDPSITAEYYSLYEEFEVGTYYPSFNRAFELWVTPGVIACWDSSKVADFILKVLDDDSTNTEDIFPKVWNYFCFNDSDTTYAGIHFKRGTQTYDNLRLYLYDFVSDTTHFGCGEPNNFIECRGHSGQGSNAIILNIDDGRRSLDYITELTFAHELQHICFDINFVVPPAVAYDDIDETMSTAASHFVKGYIHTDNKYDVTYDASIFRGVYCEEADKYMTEEAWIGYLIDVMANSPGIEDDLVYNWIRYEDNGIRKLTMKSLAAVLYESSDYSWLGGTAGDIRLQNLFQFYAVAKFCNAPNFGSNGRFGYDGVFSPVTHLKIFIDANDYYEDGATPQTPVDCPTEDPGPGHYGQWNVRVIPPSYELGSSNDNIMTEVSGIYRDGDDTPADTTDGDKSRDYIDVWIYGCDYIIFKAGNYYQDNEYHEFHFSLNGDDSSPNSNTELKLWVIGYNSTEDTLQLHPEDLVFIEPTYIHPDSLNGYTVVTDFGRTIKSVVVAIPLVETTASDPGSYRYQRYEYSYGVFTPDDEDITWKGNVFISGDVTYESDASLTIDSGTDILVASVDSAGIGSDTNLVELNIEGSLDINGTSSNPVTFEPWDDGDFGDWVGFYFDSNSSGGTFDYCTIKHAEIPIETYVPITINHCTIDSADYCGIHVVYDSTTINNTTIKNIDSFGLFLGASIVSIDSSTIEDCASFGIQLNGADTLYATNSTFSNNDRGIIINDSSVAFIEDCEIDDNDIGISLDDIPSGYVEIKDTKIESNTTDGIYCDNSSDPDILSCVIRYNDIGIVCKSSSDPFIEGSTITYNVDGIHASTSSNPDVGHDDVSGENSIHHNTDDHIVNLSTGVTIKAEDNWWGSARGPKSTKFVGSVDYYPFKTYVPQSSQRDINDNLKLPSIFSLSKTVPNPFNPATRIFYDVPSPGSHVSIIIYNVAGQVIKILVNDHKSPGYYDVLWDGTNNHGIAVASSVYFVRMVADRFVQTKKVVLLK